jgi:hypothetical protein
MRAEQWVAIAAITVMLVAFLGFIFYLYRQDVAAERRLRGWRDE